MPRVAREAGTRERIIDAARAVMLNKGLVRATTKEIARAAGVSEGTIYNYFASKEDLFLCTLTQLRSGFVTLMRELHERAHRSCVVDSVQRRAVGSRFLW
jgi:AcrR family transcriptional regulator